MIDNSKDMKVTIVVRVTTDLKSKIANAAESDNRTVSNWVRNLIERELNKE